MGFTSRHAPCAWTGGGLPTIESSANVKIVNSMYLMAGSPLLMEQGLKRGKSFAKRGQCAPGFLFDLFWRFIPFLGPHLLAAARYAHRNSGSNVAPFSCDLNGHAVAFISNSNIFIREVEGLAGEFFEPLFCVIHNHRDSTIPKRIAEARTPDGRRSSHRSACHIAIVPSRTHAERGKDHRVACTERAV